MSRRVEIELVKNGLNACTDCIFWGYAGCEQPEELDCGIDSQDEHWEIVKEDEK